MLDKIIFRVIYAAISATFLTMVSHYIWTRIDPRSVPPAGSDQKPRRDGSDGFAAKKDSKASDASRRARGEEKRRRRRPSRRVPCGESKGQPQYQRRFHPRNLNEVNMKDRNFSQARYK
jgi:hypothetical protein